MLTIIQVGHEEASDRYIRNKTKAIAKEGLEAKVVHLRVTCNTDDVIKAINDANDSTAIMVQLPLPEHIDKRKVLDAIPPEKDIDGLNSKSNYIPLTPAAILRYLEEIEYNLPGATVSIIGRSELVGKPLANELIKKGCTVCCFNSKSKQALMQHICGLSDIVIVAVGKKNFVNANFLNRYFKQIWIDVGINKTKDGKIVGDIRQETIPVIERYGGYATPVPGGVGVWTVRELVLRLKEMENAILDI